MVIVATTFGLEPAESTLLAALVAGAIALYLNRVGQKRAENDRRRTLYGEAFQAALAWCEGVWRVRRRPADGSGDAALVEHFHSMQERIAYFEGWLSIESRELGRAYRALLGNITSQCKPLLQAAWDSPGRHPSVPTPEGEAAPDVAAAKQQFLADARDHQSRNPFVRRRLRRRYPPAKEQT